MQGQRQQRGWRILGTWRGLFALLFAMFWLARLTILLAAGVGLVSDQINETVGAASWAMFGIWFGVLGTNGRWKYPSAARIIRGTLLVVCIVTLGWSGLAIARIAPMPDDSLGFAIALLTGASLLLQFLQWEQERQLRLTDQRTASPLATREDCNAGEQ
jgi:hypothetical protein